MVLPAARFKRAVDDPPPPAGLLLSCLSPGEYTATCWDTYAGVAGGEARLTVSVAGRMCLPLPAFARDRALAMRRLAPRPRRRPRRPMIEAIKFWNEPNNLSHWDFEMDPGWQEFAVMIRMAAAAVRAVCPTLRLVLGGISPIDPGFLTLLDRQHVLESLDAVAVHGFPLDWNHWQINDWPRKLDEIRAVTNLPIWVTEVGASTFGADEIQVFGLQRTAELLLGRAERVFWYSLLDLPPAWEATTRHKESEGSAYYRHFYMGLVRADGTPKAALPYLDPAMGLVQWFHFEDPRLDLAVDWLRKLGVRQVRTGISWADWFRPRALAWFDRQMAALEEFDTTITLCFTPPSSGKRPSVTSPPVRPEEFAYFAQQVVRRYVLHER